MSTQFTYFLNWMGPINTKWLAENGGNWCAGRIDVRGGDEDEYPYGQELAVPIMSGASWSRFGEWLNTLRTDTMLELDELVARFERETGWSIEWFDKERMR